MPPKKKGASKEGESKVVILGRSRNNVGMGIVGLPNVGKSTFFNTLTKLNVPAENYAFCTKDPNEAKVPVPDKRFQKLCAAFTPKSEKPAVLTITDIAGLVRGASAGQGLGNAFLSHIRAVDAIYHMVRAFEDKHISHVEESVDPIRDMQIIENELRIKDLETCSNAANGMEKAVGRGVGGKEKKYEYDTLRKVEAVLEAGKEVRSVAWDNNEIPILNTYQFLTAKPMIYLVNLRVSSFCNKRSNWLPRIIEYVNAKGLSEPVIPISAAYEQGIVDAELNGEETLKAYVDEHGGVPSILPKVIKLGYKTLQMISFFTVGEDEVRQWSVRVGCTAPRAAGTIHTDFEKNFICADIYSFKDFKKNGATKEAVGQLKAAGRLRQEGKRYVIQDGDVCLFKHNTR